MSYTLWNPADYDGTLPLGHQRNPYEKSEISVYDDVYYLREGNIGQNYIAVYMGFKKRFTVKAVQHLGYGSVPMELVGKYYHYFSFIYKLRYDTFTIDSWSLWDDLHNVLVEMQKRGDFTPEVQKAVLTLDPKQIYEAIVDRLIAIDVKVDLSMDWRKGTKYEIKW